MRNYDDYVKHRRNLILAMRKAGAGFDVIVEALRSESESLSMHQTSMRPLVRKPLEISAEKRGASAASLHEDETSCAEVV